MKETFLYTLDGKLYANLTNRCCNACSFCIRNNGSGVGDGDDLWLAREPGAEEVVELLESRYADHKELVFCGYGEPTYRMDAVRPVAEAAHRLGMRTRINTNGLGNLINGRDIVPELKGAIDVVSVSLNADNADDYDKLVRSRFGKAAFSAMLDFVRECTAAGIETVLTVVDVDGVDVAKCRELAAGTGARLRVRELIK